MARYVCKVRVSSQAVVLECLDTATGEKTVDKIVGPARMGWQGMVSDLRAKGFEVTVEPLQAEEVEHE
jgi:hypothetical protein